MNMNDIYSCSSVVLAHGIDMSAGVGIFLIIVMPLLVLTPLLYKKSIKVLFISSIIPYIIVSISILDFSFNLFAPTSIVVKICSVMVFYPGFIFSNMGFFFFVAAFVIDTLIIFGIIRLIIFIKHKVSSKKSAAVQ
jgi:hypothetical protein